MNKFPIDEHPTACRMIFGKNIAQACVGKHPLFSFRILPHGPYCWNHQVIAHASGSHIPQSSLFRCLPCLFPRLRVLPALGSTRHGTWTNLQFQTPPDAVDNTSPARSTLVI